MRFKSHAERVQHPQAKIIPESLWESEFSLWEKNEFISRGDIWTDFPDELIELIKSLEGNFNSATFFSYFKTQLPNLESFKVNALFIAALSYPKLNLQFLIEIKELLNIQDRLFFHICVELGQLELIQLLFDTDFFGNGLKE